MKLNWFSPLPPARSDIAHYTTRILPALSKHVELVIWTDQTKWDAELRQHATIQHYNDSNVSWPELNRSDATVYNIGNNHLFHSSIWEVSRRHAGITILHDFRLHHFFDSYYRRSRGAEYLDQMESYYGAKGRAAALKSITSNTPNIDLLAQRYPLTPLALENSLAVLVHTEEAFRELSHANRWLLARAELPFAASPRVNCQRHHQRSASADAPYRLIVFGYLSRNRRLDVLFEALAQLPERELFHLDLYGEIWDERAVRKEIRARSLRKLVTIHGFVPETELDRALENADVAINLRYPSVGEASGSQLRIWAHALPSIVSKTGWYATLPDRAVLHVRPEHETDDIQMHLRAFLAEPIRFAEMGQYGYQILAEHHTPDAYAQTLIELAAEARKFRSLVLTYDLAKRVSELVRPWSNAMSVGDISKRLAQQVCDLSNGRLQNR